MEKIKTTGTLTNVLTSAHPEDVSGILQREKDSMLQGENPFGDYFREVLRAKGLRQQEVFLAADFSDGYGYKLLSGEKHTSNRDTVIRLCLGGRFTLDEVQRALKLYGMSPLYARVPRDAVLIIAVNREIYALEEVNRLLTSHGMKEIGGYPGES